jgi:holin-like protein
MIGQFTIIVSILAIAYILEVGLSLPIPASIIGMLILLILLLTKIIKLKQVEGISDLLQREITLFLLPLSIGIIGSIELFEGKFLLTILIVVISTIISIFTTAIIMKFMLNKGQRQGEIK